MNYGKFGSYCYAPHMLKNWEVSGFGLTQQNRTLGGNYGEGEKRDLRSYTFFFLILSGTFLFSKASHHDPVVLSFCPATQSFHLGVEGKGFFSIPGVLTVSLVLVKSDTS